MGFSGVEILQDGLVLSGLNRLRAGTRTVYFDDIEAVGAAGPNGRKGQGLLLTLKDGRRVSLSLPSALAANQLAEDLNEILHPRVIHLPRPLSFDEVADTARALAGSRGANIRKVCDFLIGQAICHQAGDLNMEPSASGLEVLFKINGVLFPIMKFDPALGERVVSCLKVAAGLMLYRRDVIQEGRIVHDTGGDRQDIRVSIMPAESGERVAIRLFDKLKGGARLEELGFSPEMMGRLRQITAAPAGFHTICGPSGSGKTTTLYALLREIKATRGRLFSIITLEDPIEYRLPEITQVQVTHDGRLTFAGALKAALRQDPGVIMVGEIRDPETADAAIQAALTGHLVLSSVHCGSSAEAVTRLLDLGVRPFLLNSALRGSLCQRLVRRVCPDCRKTESGSAVSGEIRATGAGCGRCRQTGYTGRAVIAEFLTPGEGVSGLIERLADTRAIERAAVAEGMKTLRESGLELIQAGVTDPEEIRRVLG